MFSNAALERNKAIAQNWIDQLFNASLMAFVGCSTAAVLAIGGPTSAGDAQVTIPMPKGFSTNMSSAPHTMNRSRSNCSAQPTRRSVKAGVS